ncbi:hypothetical protein [Porphyromonas crevioricanis]|nr:hypothetical protein [Porphyromonas crevioricanis]
MYYCKKMLLLPLCYLLLSACSGTLREQNRLLEQADSAMIMGDYRSAVEYYKNIDRLDLTDTASRQQAIRLRRQAKWMFNMQRLDSIKNVMELLSKQITELAPGFQVLQEKEHSSRVRLSRPSLAPSKNKSAPHLRLATDSLGIVELTSVYIGKQAIEHTALRLRNKETGEKFSTPHMRYDEALNYRYGSSGMKYEIVCYPSTIIDSLARFLREMYDRKQSLEVLFLDSQGQEVARGVNYDNSHLADFIDTFTLAEAYAKRQRLQTIVAMINSENRYLLSTGHVDDKRTYLSQPIRK